MIGLSYIDIIRLEKVGEGEGGGVGAGAEKNIMMSSILQSPGRRHKMQASLLNTTITAGSFYYITICAIII